MPPQRYLNVYHRGRNLGRFALIDEALREARRHDGAAVFLEPGEALVWPVETPRQLARILRLSCPHLLDNRFIATQALYHACRERFPARDTRAHTVVDPGWIQAVWWLKIQGVVYDVFWDPDLDSGEKLHPPYWRGHPHNRPQMDPGKGARAVLDTLRALGALAPSDATAAHPHA